MGSAPQTYIVSYTTPITRTNLATNPSFETNLTGWTTVGTVNRVTTQQIYGSASAELVYTGAGTVLIQNNPLISVSPGITYTYSFYCKQSVDTGILVSNILWYNSAGVQILDDVHVSNNPNTTWQRFSQTRTAPANAASMAVRFYQTPGESGGAIATNNYIDGVLIEQSATLLPYFDGSTYTAMDPVYYYNLGAAVGWTGTPNNSTSTLSIKQWLTLSNVQEINLSQGKRLYQDVLQASSANIIARYPSGFASPNTQLKIGTDLRVMRQGSDFQHWIGKIRDVAVEYGIPYSASVGPADYLVIDGEGAFADWGRSQGNNQAIAANTFDVQLQAALTAGLTGIANFIGTPPQIGAATVSGSWLEWLNRAVSSIACLASDGEGRVIIQDKNRTNALAISFSDTVNDATRQVYDKIEYRSMAADYYTQVQVETSSYGNIVASSGSAPYRTYTTTTYNSSAAQATDLANYWLNAYTNPGVSIYSISCSSEAQNSWALDLGVEWWQTIGSRTSVTFRGTTAYFTILGGTITATPEGSRFTYYLAAADLEPWLTLNSSQYGQLNTNKLSF